MRPIIRFTGFLWLIAWVVLTLLPPWHPGKSGRTPPTSPAHPSAMARVPSKHRRSGRSAQEMPGRSTSFPVLGIQPDPGDDRRPIRTTRVSGAHREKDDRRLPSAPASPVLSRISGTGPLLRC